MITRIGSSVSPYAHKTQKVAPGASPFDRLLKSGVIRVGYANERPFSYRVGHAGAIEGESWDIASHVLQQLGFQRIDGIQTEFWSLIPKLLNGTYDLIAAGIFVTPLRYKEIRFSSPTYQNKEGLIVGIGNPLRLNSYADIIRHPSARIAVVFGSVAASHLRLNHVPTNRIIQYADGKTAVIGVRDREADAFISSNVILNELMLEYGTQGISRIPTFDGFKVNGISVVDFGAFGFRKTDTSFRDQFNQILNPFIGSSAHLAMIAKYGFGVDDLPGPIPTHLQSLLD